MGINTKVIMDSTAVATYHKIDSISELKWDALGESKVILAISQYISQEARSQGASPVNRKYQQFKLDNALTSVLRFILYKTVLPLTPEFASAEIAEEGELKNMFNLFKYLSDAEMSVMALALQDVLSLKGEDPENYRDLYLRFKEDTLSTIG